MRTKQGNVLESLRSVQSFINANAPALGGVAATGAKRQLDDTILQLDAHAGAQTGNTLVAKSATQKHVSLRQALLRDHMVPIAKIAAASLPHTPEVEPLRMPQGRPSPERLRAAAIGMAAAAAPFTSVFVASGLAPNFIDQLTAAADATTDVIGARKQSRVIVGGATKGLTVLLSAGRRLVHVLDAFVKTALKEDPSLLAAWNMAKRVGKTSGAKSAPHTPPPVPTPTSSAHSADPAEPALGAAA